MKIYLAATNSGMSKADREAVITERRPLYVLETFFSGERDCRRAMDTVGNDNFLLDSGAFSFMSGAETSKAQMEEYLARYIAFIQQHHVKHFFEIDVDNIFGLEQVRKWTARLERETGRQCIPVWHKGRGVDYWRRMCDEYPYIAVGGLVFHVRQSEYPLIKKLVDYAYYRGVKVHGLGFTKTTSLREYSFFSVDSAAWVRAACIGQQIHRFQDGSIKMRKLNKGNRKVELSKLAAHNFREWIKYQYFMDGKL